MTRHFQTYLPLQGKQRIAFWLGLLIIIPFGVIMIGVTMASQIINGLQHLSWVGATTAVIVAGVGFFFWAALFGQNILAWYRSGFVTQPDMQQRLHRHHKNLERFGPKSLRSLEQYGTQHIQKEHVKRLVHDISFCFKLWRIDTHQWASAKKLHEALMTDSFENKTESIRSKGACFDKEKIRQWKKTINDVKQKDPHCQQHIFSGLRGWFEADGLAYLKIDEADTKTGAADIKHPNDEVVAAEPSPSKSRVGAQAGIAWLLGQGLLWWLAISNLHPQQPLALLHAPWMIISMLAITLVVIGWMYYASAAPKPTGFEDKDIQAITNSYRDNIVLLLQSITTTMEKNEYLPSDRQHIQGYFQLLLANHLETEERQVVSGYQVNGAKTAIRGLGFFNCFVHASATFWGGFQLLVTVLSLTTLVMLGPHVNAFLLACMFGTGLLAAGALTRKAIYKYYYNEITLPYFTKKCTNITKHTRKTLDKLTDKRKNSIFPNRTWLDARLAGPTGKALAWITAVGFAVFSYQAGTHVLPAMWSMFGHHVHWPILTTIIGVLWALSTLLASNSFYGYFRKKPLPKPKVTSWPAKILFYGLPCIPTAATVVMLFMATIGPSSPWIAMLHTWLPTAGLTYTTWTLAMVIGLCNLALIYKLFLVAMSRLLQCFSFDQDTRQLFALQAPSKASPPCLPGSTKTRIRPKESGGETKTPDRKGARR